VGVIDPVAALAAPIVSRVTTPMHWTSSGSRTVQGSVFSSVVAILLAFVFNGTISLPVFVSVVGVTLLEGTTTQISSLVLPLLGASLMMVASLEYA